MQQIYRRHPCWRVIRTPFIKNTSERLLMNFGEILPIRITLHLLKMSENHYTENTLRYKCFEETLISRDCNCLCDYLKNTFLRSQRKFEKLILALDVFCKLQKCWIVACFLPWDHLFKAYVKFSKKPIFLTLSVRNVNLLKMLRTK